MSHEGEYLCVAGLLAGWYVCLSVVAVQDGWSVWVVCVCLCGCRSRMLLGSSVPRCQRANIYGDALSNSSISSRMYT